MPSALPYTANIRSIEEARKVYRIVKRYANAIDDKGKIMNDDKETETTEKESTGQRFGVEPVDVSVKMDQVEYPYIIPDGRLFRFATLMPPLKDEY